MTLREQLTRDGFDPVPRDDRLFDVFPDLTRHRGIELWEKWSEAEVKLVAIKFQDSKAKPQNLKLRRSQLEEALLRSTVFTLED